MPKPIKIDKCGVRLLKVRDKPFESFVEIRPDHRIENGAVVKISGRCLIDGTLQDCLWESRPIDLANDVKKGEKSKRVFLKLLLTLGPPTTSKSDQIPASPEVIVVTITNDPSGTPQTSDPEDADPIFFP